MTSIAVSILLISSFVGNVVAGPIAEVLGRKLALIVGNAIIIISWIITYFAPNFSIILTGRIIMGLGTGVSFATGVTLTSEIGLIAYRGTLSITNTMCWTFSFVLGLIIGSSAGINVYAPGEKNR